MLKHLFYFILPFVAIMSCNFSSKPEAGSTMAQTDDSTKDSGKTVVQTDRQYLVKVGDMAPNFEMQLPNGDTIILSSLRGKVVMLQFTASWCGVCRKEMPHIESDIWQKHKHNPNFALYGIDREEPAYKIKEFREATDVTYPIGLDPDARIFSLYAEKDAGITRNVIIDKGGTIVMLTRLYEEKEFARMVALISRLLQS